MNAQELKLLRTLEFIKYLTLKGKQVIYSSIEQRTHYAGGTSGLTLSLPEGDQGGLILKIKNYRVNYKRPTGEGKCSITVDWNKDDNGGGAANGGMKPSKTSIMNNGNKLFVFHSVEFRAMSVEQKAAQNNEIDTHLNTGGFWLHLYSVLIEIIQENGHFESFMSMPYGSDESTGTWKYYFNNAVVEAVEDHNFNNFLKYDPRIWAEELSLDDRVKILKYLVADPNWGGNSFEGLNGPQFFSQLVITVKEDQKVLLYENFFNDSSILFRNSMSKLQGYEEEKLEVILFLLKSFWQKISEDDNYINQIENLTEDKIMPVFYWRESYSTAYRQQGPIIYSDYYSSGVTIYKIDIRYQGYKNALYRLSNGTIVENFSFSYETMVGGFCCSPVLADVGLMRGRIYPLPAFAIVEMHKIFSEKIAFSQLVSDIVNVVSVMLPFFKLVQGIKVLGNLTTIGLSMMGIVLDNSNLSETLKGDPVGERFLYSYIFISTFYSGKGIYKSAQVNKLFMFSDYETLMNLWGLFQNTQLYIYLNTQEEDYNLKNEFKVMKNNMIEYEKTYNRMNNN